MGVYKVGRSPNQEAFAENTKKLFDALAKADKILETNRYLLGSHITEADIRMYVTLIRFDPAYHNMLKVK